jgi:hypothetical protein
MATKAKVVLRAARIAGAPGYRIESIHGNTNIVSFVVNRGIRNARVGEFVTHAEADTMVKSIAYDVSSKA